ncbi:cytochrome c oxidase accessory protein CcoG [Noviherbaspirillum sp.]|uniref:cytochrome c oxidase accessory protein CcoG n=1 Tax=Noviherbaspirillum sp. TaxID=1926288 RepID=UPI002B467C65|nr:cytochrome c oxidase accessory protein CcoG [Noviherbaspirillum sp.]HJV79475.1 cytochrome c oxidase accessory protein CcoG [Noviherbaspirillum sp.]
MRSQNLKVIPITPAVETQQVEQSLYQARRKIYPRSVKGAFVRWRWIMVWLTQAVFYGLPWLMWNDRQAVLFDLDARKFHIFGLIFWPQDFIYLSALLVVSALSLFLFTAVAGRLFCGYVCPQTVYTEIFMWIERKIEGDRAARMRLDREPLSARKLGLKAAKHGSWLAVAGWTGFTFVGYFTSIRSLAHQIGALGLGPWQTFWICFYSFATYGQAGWMREQVCKYMCPYARFQSSMFDKDTLIITYDTERGEPRGARGKKADPKALGLGSCVDCGLCVEVCPTGIDIRNGLQYECIACAACVDTCNQVMDKMGYEKGLVRYTTQYAINNKLDRQGIWRRVLRVRTLIYFTILLTIIFAAGLSLALRTPLKVDVIRDRGLPRLVEEGAIENVYRLQVMNTDERPHHYIIEVSGLPGIKLSSDDDFDVPAATTKAVPVRVQVMPQSGQSGSMPIRFVVREERNAAISVTEKAVFLIPK